MTAVLLLVLVLGAALGLCGWLFPQALVETARRPLRRLAGLKKRAILVEDHSWAYLSGGRGETLVLLHGFGGEKDFWGPFLWSFRRRFQLVVPDLPGFGETSRRPSAAYDIPAQTARLKHFVGALGLGRFHLLGISMGGYIAACFAAECPERVLSLILMDSAGVASPEPSDAWRRYRRDGTIPFLCRSVREIEELIALLFHRPPWIPARFKRYLTRRAAERYAWHEKVLRDMERGGMELLEGRLERISAPTLLIWGARDRITHVSSVRRFESGIRNCRTVILEDCGHVPYLEKKAETREACRMFLAAVRTL